MRHFILTAFLFYALFGASAVAEDAKDKESVRIEVDQSAKTFTFIIDGEPVALLDIAGLHVVGDITYGGVMTDSGGEWVKDRMASQGKEDADE